MGTSTFQVMDVQRQMRISSALCEESRELIERAQRNAIEFMRTDIELALSFLDRAKVVSNPEHRERLVASAQRAYDTVGYFLMRFESSPDERDEINAGAEVLRERPNDLRR